jgi:hypothetical protein
MLYLPFKFDYLTISKKMGNKKKIHLHLFK